MKKMATIGLLATSILILTACSTTKNKENSAAAKEDTVTSQSSETKEEKVNLNGKDAVEYYNVNYTKPKNLDSIVGVYLDEESKTNMIVFADGRYTNIYMGKTFYNTTYFDKNNTIQEKEMTDTAVTVVDTGRIVEKDGIDYVVSLGDINSFTNLDSEGHQVENQFFTTETKNDIKDRLKTPEEYGFIKDGKYFESKDTPTDLSWKKVESDSKTKTALENVTFKFYENNPEKASQYVNDLLSSNSVNDLYYLVGIGRDNDLTDIEDQEIKVLSSDELKSVKGTNNKLKYGFKLTHIYKIDGTLEEFPNKAYATDGSTVYSLSYDQLGITAEEIGSADSPSSFLE
jgi:hypothetical protein